MPIGSERLWEGGRTNKTLLVSFTFSLLTVGYFAFLQLHVYFFFIIFVTSDSLRTLVRRQVGVFYKAQVITISRMT